MDFATMPYEMIVAMHVADATSYAHYREHMMPILASYGGAFQYDFVVAETLRGEFDHPVNRLFCIRFPSEAAKEAFFADAAYHQVRATYYAPAVAGRTLLREASL
jgi:uncharacterized protein (DUF1330 family)